MLKEETHLTTFINRLKAIIYHLENAALEGRGSTKAK
jgi:hypothetical protein